MYRVYFKGKVSCGILTKLVCALSLFLLIMLFAGQAVMAQPKVFTLSEATEIALTKAPDVLSRLAQLEGVKSETKMAKGSLYPQLNAYANFSRLSDPVAVVPIKGFGRNPPYFSRDLFKAGINFYMPIYQGGKLRADLKKAQFKEKAETYSLNAYKEVLAAQVANTFYAVIYLKSLLKAKQVTFKALEAQKENAEAAYNVGKIAKLDLMEIETQLASQHQEIVSTREAITRTRQQFALLLGLTPPYDFVLQGSLGPEVNKHLDTLVVKPDDLKKEVILAEIIDRRSDIIAAQNQLVSAKQGVRAAKALHMPSLALVGDYGRHAGSGLEGNEEVWSFGVNLNFNIFSGGTISAKISQAEARVLAAEQQLKQLKAQAASQILAALSSLEEAEARIYLAESVQHTAEEAFRIERLKYEKGAGTISDVLKAQASWDSAKASLVKALFDKLKAITDLRLYTGTILDDYPKITN